MRGLERTATMLEAITAAMPRLGVDPHRCRQALAGGALATDEVMRRVEEGRPFRAAYREVAEALKEGERFDPPSDASIISRRQSIGNLGNLGLPPLRTRIRKLRTWARQERRRFDRALAKLAADAARPPVRPSARP